MGRRKHTDVSYGNSTQESVHTAWLARGNGPVLPYAVSSTEALGKYMGPLYVTLSEEPLKCLMY